MNYASVLVQLPLVKETTRERVRSPEDVARICGDIGAFAQETFHVISLNAKNCMTNRALISVGLVDASLVHPREVFRLAVHENAAAVVLTHNHPSGDPEPGSQDISTTRMIRDAGTIMGIHLLDHVIVGSNRYVSLAERGYCSGP